MMIRYLTSITLAMTGMFALHLDLCQAAPGDLLFKLTAPDPQPGASFGMNLATVDGDVLIGAMTADLDLGIDATGRAYLFDGQTGQLKLTFDNPEPMRNDFFGSSLAGGDGRVFISARGVPDRVYAFDTQTGEHLHTIDQPTQFHNSFAAAIAYGNGSVLVSSPAFSIPFGLQGIGQAELFDAVAGELQRPLPNPEPDTGDNIGTSVTLAGKRAIVGAISDDFPDGSTVEGNNAGRVWVFNQLTGAILLTLENPNPQRIGPNFFSDWFGYSVAANDRLIVVGARQEDANGVNDSGAAYVFDSKTGALLHTLLSPNLEEKAYFGHSVAVTPAGQVLVASNSASVDGHADAGRVFLFDGLSGNLLLDIPNPEFNRLAGFGFSVAATDDRLFVGTPTGAETVFVFEAIPEPTSMVLSVVSVCLFGIGAAAKSRKRYCRHF